ncbi:hypothetical protein ACVWWN_002527 [Mycobacterium sp. URHB0021]
MVSVPVIADCSALPVESTTLVAPASTMSMPALAIDRTVPATPEPRLKTASAGATVRA